MKNMGFKYSAVVITGASSGIGESFLKSILKLDQNIFICNLSRRKPEMDISGDKFRHFFCDLKEAENREYVFSEMVKLFKEKGIEGPILLINNSGFGDYGEFRDVVVKRQLDMISVNIMAVVHLTGLFLPILLKQGGDIINISSAAAFQPTPFMATYGASKSFILNWGLAIGEELKLAGVHVLTVCPGPTRTNFFKAADFDLGSNFYQSSEEVVQIAWRAMAAKKAFVVCGWRSRILTSVARLLPLAWLTKVSGTILRKVRNKKSKVGN